MKKAVIFSLVALALGITAGIAWTRQEFSREVVPVDLTTHAPVKATKGATAKIGPKVAIVNGERYDFGSMDRNGHGKHDWEIRNDGDAALTLETGQPSCGICIKVFTVGKPLLEPGERTEVHVEFEVKTSDTNFEQSGPLKTNDPNRPSVHLSIHGHVIDNVRLDRPDIHFSDLSASESASGSANMYSFREGDLKVEEHVFNNPKLGQFLDISFTPLTEAEIAREPKAKAGLKVNIAVKPGMPQGDFNDTLTINTNQSPDALQLRIIGNIASDIMLMGQNVFREKQIVSLGAIPQKAGKKHTIYLLVKGPHRDDTKVTIDRVEPSTEFSATLGEPIRDTAKTIRYPIVIEVPPGAAPVTHGEGSYAKVRITTTHPEIKELDLKVRYVVKE